MKRAAVIFILGVSGVVGLDIHQRLRNMGHMQPDMVARTLVQVEDDWKAQAASFEECSVDTVNAQCDVAKQAFSKSCTTVVGSIMQASSGSRDAVQEYMKEVCGEGVLDSWHSDRCTDMTSTLTYAMSPSSYENRESLDVGMVCTGFWSIFAKTEHDRVQKEMDRRRAQEEEMERVRAVASKKAEDMRKQLAEQRAEVKRAAEEDAKLKAAENQLKGEEERQLVTQHVEEAKLLRDGSDSAKNTYAAQMDAKLKEKQAEMQTHLDKVQQTLADASSMAERARGKAAIVGTKLAAARAARETAKSEPQHAMPAGPRTKSAPQARSAQLATSLPQQTKPPEPATIVPQQAKPATAATSSKISVKGALRKNATVP